MTVQSNSYLIMYTIKISVMILYVYPKSDNLLSNKYVVPHDKYDQISELTIFLNLNDLNRVFVFTVV